MEDWNQDPFGSSREQKPEQDPYAQTDDNGTEGWTDERQPDYSAGDNSWKYTGDFDESDTDPAPEGEPYTSRYDIYRFRETDGNRDPYEEPQRPKNRKNKRRPFLTVLICLAAVVCFIAVVIAARIDSSVSPDADASSDGSVVFGNTEDGESAASDAESGEGPETGNVISGTLPDVIGSAGSTQNPEMTVAEVAALAMPAMVQITNTSLTQYYNLFGQAEEYEEVSAGSGIIIGENEDEYLIATNEHVISNSDSITVTFVDDAAVSGTVKASDSIDDLAVVSVLKSDMEADTIGAVSVISIGDSDSCVVGEQVVAIGNALGYGQSVSAGYVSALNRDVEVDNVTHKLIQTDASINPGNSGGALLNMRGELIGINEIKYVDSSVEGVGYAIPTATAEPILEELGTAEPKKVLSEAERGYLGVTCMDMPGVYVSQGYPAGAYLVSVNSGSPAGKAGLQEGDIITGVNGTTVSGQETLISELSYYAAGETIQITYSRMSDDQMDFVSNTVSLTLADRSGAGLDTEPAEEASDRREEEQERNFGFQLPGPQ